MAESTLMSARVQAVLKRLYRNAEAVDAAVLARTNPVTDTLDGDEKIRVRSEMLGEAYLPVPPDVGRLLYILARAHPSRTVVEFGTALAISTIHFAAAVRDSGGCKVITTEINAEKARRAGGHLREAGLLDFVEIRVGDARETLRNLDHPVDFVFLDGWKELYLPVLKVIEPNLRDGALVTADNLNLASKELKPFVEYISREENGYLSVEVPIGDRLEISMRIESR